MAGQNRGNALVNNKVNLPQQQIILSKNPIINGNGLQSNGATVTTISMGNGINASISGNLSAGTVNGDQMATIYHMNGQRNFIGPLKVYSTYLLKVHHTHKLTGRTHTRKMANHLSNDRKWQNNSRTSQDFENYKRPMKRPELWKHFLCSVNRIHQMKSIVSHY